MKQRIAFLKYGFQLYAYQKNAHHLFFNVAFGVPSYQVNIHENGNSNSFSIALDDLGGSLNID
uniref:hypothetical protein n=1 Tax=Flavobacterium sp. TaxID=239 RepID=UPI00404A9EBC